MSLQFCASTHNPPETHTLTATLSMVAPNRTPPPVSGSHENRYTAVYSHGAAVQGNEKKYKVGAHMMLNVTGMTPGEKAARLRMTYYVSPCTQSPKAGKTRLCLEVKAAALGGVTKREYVGGG